MEGGSTKRNCLLAGELARLAGVSTDTLRHYERKKVLPKPARSSGGYRMYPESSLDRVRLIRQALSIGFTLDELSVFLAERNRGNAPCREVRALAAEKLENIEQQLKALTILRNDLKALLQDWDNSLSTAKNGSPHRLLEKLSHRPTAANPPPNPLKKRNRVK